MEQRRPTRIRRVSRRVPLSRFAAIGAATAGALGAVIGLIIGLFVYAPTCVVAAFEVGLPAALVGSVAGLIVGLVSDQPLRSK